MQRKHLTYDNEYAENWCDSKDADKWDSTYDIDEVTCSTCLVNLMKAGARAQERLAVVGH